MHADDGTLNPVLHAAGWYTLLEQATRHPDHRLPPGTLSTKASLRLRFYANPATSHLVRAYLTRVRPAGLDAANRAARASTTAVSLRPQRPAPHDDLVQQLSDSVRAVRAWASSDSGRTWHAVRVVHSGRTWTALVHNGASGTESLRATVTDTHGGAATTTVIDAYAVR